MQSCHIKMGDTVQVRSGDDKGKQGKVLAVARATGRARVEGVRMVKRHLKKGRSTSAPEGGIIEEWGMLDVSKLAVVCPRCNKASKMSRVKNGEGKKVRICKKCKEQVD